MLNYIRLFCDESEKNMIDSCIQTIQMIQNISSYQELMQSLSSENENPTDFMKTFLTPEQQAMFETYQTMLNTQKEVLKMENENWMNNPNLKHIEMCIRDRYKILSLKSECGYTPVSNTTVVIPCP